MMKNILILATAGAGGDLQPLIAVALGLRERGHRLVFFGDTSVATSIQNLAIKTIISAPQHDLGPRLIATIKGSQGLEPVDQGKQINQQLTAWSLDLVPPVQELVRDYQPDLLVTSLFGAGVAQLVATEMNLPWCIINSTFYAGANAPRQLDQDFSPRAVPLFRYYFLPLLEQASLVLHATDPSFDNNNTNLPPRHHYVGPLLWEPPAKTPDYITEPGNPWVLVTLSSQEQDDLPIAQMALDGLADQPVRVALTIGGAHDPTELKHIPDNARVEHYLPHSKVLEQSRLLISHAGHGSVMKALWYGVPMLLVPWGRDQPGVAARAEQLGVAKVVSRDQLTVEHLAQAIQYVLKDELLREGSHRVSQRLQTQDPVAKACRLLEQL
jgi:UDP:flavonoid glycosyltransferase YjiC (YdhE family)